MSINLNIDSFKKISNGSNQAMVYGWKSCLYTQVADALELENIKVFDYHLGCKSTPSFFKKTLEGKLIKQMDFEHTETDYWRRMCKTAINNLMFENYKRKLNNSPIIPLIFCFDIEGKTRLVTSEDIAARNNEKVITFSELRRCYKLCCEIAKDPVLAPIAEVANESLKFVKLVKNNEDQYSLVQLSPFWKSNEWETSWKLRKASSINKVNKAISPWRSQLKYHLTPLNEKKYSSKKRERDEVNKEIYHENIKRFKLAGEGVPSLKNGGEVMHDKPYILSSEAKSAYKSDNSSSITEIGS